MCTEGKVALGALIVFAVWAFGVLPFLLGPLPYTVHGHLESRLQRGVPPPPQSAQTNQTAQADKRRTSESPSIVKVLPAAESEKQATADAAYEDDKAKSDALIALFTERLFWATVALSVIAFFQLLVFGWQGIQLKRTVDLAREEFISSHRPVMKVKFVELVEVEGEETGVRFMVVNTGTTAARVRGSCAKADYFGDTDWPNPNDYGVNNRIPLRKFEPGATDNFTIHTNEPVGFAAAHAGNPATDTLTLRFYGYIVYEDADERSMTTYFCRKWDAANDRFDPVDRPDYDSAD